MANTGRDDADLPEFHVQALGVRVAIDTSRCSADIRDAIRETWRDAAADAADGDDPVAVVAHPIESGDRDDVLAALSSQVTLLAIEARRGDLVMLHAAGVADSAGRVVALVGPSGRGKTTASRALGRHLAYVSDETIAVAPDATVFPYRKPLSVIEAVGRQKAQRAPSEVGLLALPEAPLRLAAIVLLDRLGADSDELDSGIPCVEEVDLASAIVALAPELSYLTALEAPLARLASLISIVGGVRRVRYREADTLVPVIAALAADAAPSNDDPEFSARWSTAAPPTSPRGNPRTVAQGDPAERRYTAVRGMDALLLEDPDRLLILLREPDGAGRVVSCEGIAPGLWLAARSSTRDELIAAATRRYGDAGEQAGELVDAAVSALVDAGAIEVD